MQVYGAKFENGQTSNERHQTELGLSAQSGAGSTTASNYLPLWPWSNCFAGMATPQHPFSMLREFDRRRKPTRER